MKRVKGETRIRTWSCYFAALYHGESKWWDCPATFTGTNGEVKKAGWRLGGHKDWCPLHSHTAQADQVEEGISIEIEEEARQILRELE